MTETTAREPSVDEARRTVTTRLRKRAARHRRDGLIGIFGSLIVGSIAVVFFVVQRIPAVFSSDFSDDFLKRNDPGFWVPILTQMVTRIGALLLAVYVVQVLINFTRYNFRVGDHLEAVADSVDYFGADERLLNTMLTVISPRHISFGKEPSTPAQELASLARGLADPAARKD